MTGTKLKVTVLYDLWEEAPVEAQEEVPARKRKGQKKRKKKPVKHDREEIFASLEKLGHQPSYYVLDGRPQSLLALAKCNADLIFNLTESYAGDDTKEMQIAAFLDLLEIPYTGAGPHATILAQDKSIAKKMFAFYGIQSPYFATCYRGHIDHAHDIKFPLIVKPTSEDGSIGIDADRSILRGGFDDQRELDVVRVVDGAAIAGREIGRLNPVKCEHLLGNRFVLRKDGRLRAGAGVGDLEQVQECRDLHLLGVVAGI